MIEVNKKPIFKNRSLFDGNIVKKRIIPKTYKYSCKNNLSLIKEKRKKNNKPKKCLNVIDFIRQKDKFFIENSFDVRGSREFLASKEVAMREIKLNDEIVVKKKKHKECSEPNLLPLGFNYYQENYKNNKSSKITGQYSISPRKTRKKNTKISLNVKGTDLNKKYSKKSSKKTKNGISIGTPKSKYKNIKENSSYLDSNIENDNIIYNNNLDNNDSYIYKFFIDNANETEDNFQKKLKKEIKKVEGIKKRNKDYNYQIKSLTKNDLKKPKRMNSVIVRKSKDSQSQFQFSEYTKNLMEIDDISISSINIKKEGTCNSLKKTNNKKIKRKYGSIQINNKQIKERIKKKMDRKIENEIKKEKIYSDKDSIISILSDLM